MSCVTERGMTDEATSKLTRRQHIDQVGRLRVCVESPPMPEAADESCLDLHDSRTHRKSCAQSLCYSLQTAASCDSVLM